MNKNKLLLLGIIFLIVAVSSGSYQIYFWVISDYNYEKDILYNWNLADKSSTLEAKAEYINKFIEALQRTPMSEYNAIFLKTPDNNVQNNINAVITLRDRLNEIKGMNPESFEYQTAIQQITAQEQGEADKMLSMINGGYLLKNYPIIWGWYGVVFMFLWFSLFLIGIIFVTMGKLTEEGSYY